MHALKDWSGSRLRKVFKLSASHQWFPDPEELKVQIQVISPGSPLDLLRGLINMPTNPLVESLESAQDASWADMPPASAGSFCRCRGSTRHSRLLRFKREDRFPIKETDCSLPVFVISSLFAMSKNVPENLSWSQNRSSTFPSQRADCRAYPLFLMLPDETEAGACLLDLCMKRWSFNVTALLHTPVFPHTQTSLITWLYYRYLSLLSN